MPASSESQRRLMSAAEHGATFPKARKLRETMTHEQLHDFAVKPPMAPRDRLSRGQRAMRDRSTKGSPPFEHEEFRQGYRRIG